MKASHSVLTIIQTHPTALTITNNVISQPQIDLHIHNHGLRQPPYVPRQLLAVHWVEAVEVGRGSALLVGGGGERGGGLVAVGGGRRGGVVPLRGAGPVLAAARQVRPLREGGAPLLVRAATR